MIVVIDGINAILSHDLHCVAYKKVEENSLAESAVGLQRRFWGHKPGDFVAESVFIRLHLAHHDHKASKYSARYILSTTFVKLKPQKLKSISI